MADNLVASTWTFQAYTAYTTNSTTATSALYFGNVDYRTCIQGITFTKPLESSIQLWRLSNADLMGFFVGGYYDIIGDALYVLILFAVCGSLYRRYGHFGPVAVFFALFAGPGSLLMLILPQWAIIPTATFLILGCAFILWRIIR